MAEESTIEESTIEESDIEESDIEDDDSSSFDIGEVLNWMDTSEDSGQQAKIEGGEDDDSDEGAPQL